MLFEVLLDCFPSILCNPVPVLGPQTGQAAAKPEEQARVAGRPRGQVKLMCGDIWIWVFVPVYFHPAQIQVYMYNHNSSLKTIKLVHLRVFT